MRRRETMPKIATPARACLAALFLVAATAVSTAPLPADAQRARAPAEAGRQLTAVCKRAGFADASLRDCARKIMAVCRTAGVDPRSPRCWQWLLDRDDRRELDTKALRR